MPEAAAPVAAPQAARAEPAREPEPTTEETPATGPVGATLALQRAAGNRVTGEVVRALGAVRTSGSGAGAGARLDPGLRREMEARFGVDFSGVRVHDDVAAARRASAYEARAYTHGLDISFAPGSYAPGTLDGRRLIAHELAHVVQQAHGVPAPQLDEDVGASDGPDERDADAAANVVLAGRSVPTLAVAHAPILRQAAPAAPATSVGLSVSLSGLSLDAPDDMVFKPGRKTTQLLAITLRRLVASAYKDALVGEVEAAIVKVPHTERYGGFRDTGPAKGGEKIGRISFGLRQSLVLVGFLKDKQLELQLTPSQEDLLLLGYVNLNLWADFVQTLKKDELELPKWYTKDIFDREMSQQGALLRAYADQLRRAQAGEAEAQQDFGLVGEVILALHQPAMVLDEIRRDIALAANEKTAGVYAALWQLPKAKKGEQPRLTAPPTKLRNPNMAVLILGYMRTQASLARQAEVDADSRRQLLTNFAAYTERLFYEGTGAKTGDEEIRDRPATANARAFPSSLAPMSAPPGPLLEAALGTDHRFHMEVQFPSVYETLGRYAFSWDRVQVPKEQLGQPVDVEKLQREKITNGEVATVRFDRATAYAKADINRVVDSMVSDLGPVGVGALGLVEANAILRYIGTGIRFALDVLTMPADQKLVVFPEPGLYMVRAAMAQVREGDEQVVRVPSVAYYPVLARNPDEIAAEGVNSVVKAGEERRQKIKDLDAQLAKGDLDPAERTRLQETLKDLRASEAPLGERLESQRAAAAERLEKLKAGSEGGEDDAAKVLREIEKRIALRKKRRTEGAEALNARFVSDLGQVIPLVLEVVDRPSPAKEGGRYLVYVSDVTTPKSGDETGTGKTRDDAIVDAVRTLLESTEGYGRGRVSIALPGGVRTIRIEASLGSLLTESISNVATVLTIAAVVAAPLSGGASLSFLLPLGVVGAIPSAYRVVQHVESGTFELDLENGMDIVNIAGSLIGLGRIGATSLKWVRVGRGLLIVGFGVDAAGGIMMGADFMLKIEALEKLPPGERSSQLLMLIGQTMVTGGVAIGGAIADHGHQLQAEHGAGAPRGANELPRTLAEGASVPHGETVTPVAPAAPPAVRSETPVTPTARPEAPVAPARPGAQAPAVRPEAPVAAARPEAPGAAARPEAPGEAPTEKPEPPSKPEADMQGVPAEDFRVTPEDVEDLTGRIEGGGETGGFEPVGPGVRVPVRKPPKDKPWVAHEPTRVLEAGAGKGTGPEGPTNLGIPPQRKLAPVTKTDIRSRKPAEAPAASRSRYHLDATQPVPPGLAGKFETVIVNNPRGFTPNIAELGKALAPGGRIIVQGRGRVGPPSKRNRRGFNPDFQALIDEPAPPGYRKTLDVAEGGLPPAAGNTSRDIVGGPFYRTEGDREVRPNARIIFEKLPTESAAGPAGSGPGAPATGVSAPSAAVEGQAPDGGPRPPEGATPEGAPPAAATPAPTLDFGAARESRVRLDDVLAQAGRGKVTTDPAARQQLRMEFEAALQATAYPRDRKAALRAQFDRLIEPEPPTLAQAKVAVGQDVAPEVADMPPTFVLEPAATGDAGGAPVASAGGHGSGRPSARIVAPPPPTRSAAKPPAKPPAPPRTTPAKPPPAAGAPSGTGAEAPEKAPGPASGPELLVDEAELLAEHGVTETKPVDIRLQEAQAGNTFDRDRKALYPADQVPITDRGGSRRRLDSYDPVTGEIISRKLLVTQQGQIAFIEPFDMIGHFQEFALKYRNGATIDTTRRTIKLGIAGKTLSGRYILEVPVQRYPIQDLILTEARARGITIRDTLGHEY